MKRVADKADLVLRAHWDGKFPVDPRGIAERMHATLATCSPESGSIVIKDDEVVISVNENESSVRQRFTIAHEIGHWVLGHGSNFRDSPEEFLTQSPSLVEREANAFAANLLMPKSAVQDKVFVEKASIEAMAEWFNVSRAAMKWRLRNLHLLS